MIVQPFAPYMPREYQIKYATDAWERRGAAALRRRVFCGEQGLFGEDDRDRIDDAAICIVAVSVVGVAADEVVGTVRIHETGAGVWWGSRLAVARDYRRVSALGAGLIQLAVSSAHASGCRRFLAHVQSQNAPMFHRMHWQTLEELDLHGMPHHKMVADLAFYPPCREPERGFVTLPKMAA